MAIVGIDELDVPYGGWLEPKVTVVVLPLPETVTTVDAGGHRVVTVGE